METQQSFVNGLVGILTWGIYTPMQINVKCASESRADAGGGPTLAAEIDGSASMQEQSEVLTEAVIEAMLANAGIQNYDPGEAKKAYIKFEEAIRVIRKHLAGIKEQNYFLMKTKPAA